MIKRLNFIVSGINVDGEKLRAKDMDVLLHEVDGYIPKLDAKTCVDKPIIRILAILHVQLSTAEISLTDRQKDRLNTCHFRGYESNFISRANRPVSFSPHRLIITQSQYSFDASVPDASEHPKADYEKNCPHGSVTPIFRLPIAATGEFAGIV
ncbi:MAG: hypothetical protein M5U15_11030 [Kiritimatiellae bacterium]|nr:hypothetical protein [Kiritimatiellia bacterium]